MQSNYALNHSNTRPIHFHSMGWGGAVLSCSITYRVNGPQAHVTPKNKSSEWEKGPIAQQINSIL